MGVVHGWSQPANAKMIHFPKPWVVAITLLAAGPASAAWGAPQPEAGSSEAAAAMPQRAAPLDHSGKKQKGNASYYSRKLSGRKMADGTRMDPDSDVAASKTLPLGTKARVTNLRNGKSAVVEIKDRGPYVKGRIVDLSPKTASTLGMGSRGVAPVEVAPIEVPQKDGSIKSGSGASDSGRTVAKP